MKCLSKVDWLDVRSSKQVATGRALAVASLKVAPYAVPAECVPALGNHRVLGPHLWMGGAVSTFHRLLL